MTNFKINDDGSITVAEQQSREENIILDILRIEHAKGGVFAPRRMKKRAIKYARSAGVSPVTVEKLMLDNYPDAFANYGRSNWVFFSLCMLIFFGCGTVLFFILQLNDPNLFVFFLVSACLFLLGICVDYYYKYKIGQSKLNAK